MGKLIFMLMIGHVVGATGDPPMLSDGHQEMAVKAEHAERKLTDCPARSITFIISTTELIIPYNTVATLQVVVDELKYFDAAEEEIGRSLCESFEE